MYTSLSIHYRVANICSTRELSLLVLEGRGTCGGGKVGFLSASFNLQYDPTRLSAATGLGVKSLLTCTCTCTCGRYSCWLGLKVEQLKVGVCADIGLKLPLLNHRPSLLLRRSKLSV